MIANTPGSGGMAVEIDTAVLYTKSIGNDGPARTLETGVLAGILAVNAMPMSVVAGDLICFE